MTRPKLSKGITLAEFKDYYWLKTELVEFCRLIGIRYSGGKIEIANRIIKYLETGEIEPKKTLMAKPLSTFDWNNEPLSIETVLTDNYKNTENVRRFFKQQIGVGFKFNVPFMNWLKSNTGATLGDAVVQWDVIQNKLKDKNQVKVIAPQFEYNTYIRDFLKDNPGLTRKDAIKCWNIKRELPGAKKYNKNDLLLSRF